MSYKDHLKFKDDLKHGVGKMTWEDGYSYNGEWQDGLL